MTIDARSLTHIDDEDIKRDVARLVVVHDLLGVVVVQVVPARPPDPHGLLRHHDGLAAHELVIVDRLGELPAVKEPVGVVLDVGELRPDLHPELKVSTLAHTKHLGWYVEFEFRVTCCGLG